MEDYKDIIDDAGPTVMLREHLDLLPQEQVQESEPVLSVTVEPQSLTERAAKFYNRHRKGILKLGGVGLGSVSFGAGVVLARPR